MRTAQKKKETESVAVIKKYSNRRLYDMESSKYVTLEDICAMVKKGVIFQVVDAKTGEDLTRTILTQIIFELETKGFNLLPTSFLRQIIAFYDDNMSVVLFSYLEKSMKSFMDNQERMRGHIQSADTFSLFKHMEDVGKQNMEIFEQTLSMFTQFNPMMAGCGKKDKEQKD